MTKKYLYAIGVCEKLLSKNKDEIVYASVLGVFTSFEEAEWIVLNNAMDIHEELFMYAIIYKVEFGLYQYESQCFYYKYNEEKGEYEKTETLDNLSPCFTLTLWNLPGKISFFKEMK